MEMVVVHAYPYVRSTCTWPATGMHCSRASGTPLHGDGSTYWPQASELVCAAGLYARWWRGALLLDGSDPGIACGEGSLPEDAETLD